MLLSGPEDGLNPFVSLVAFLLTNEEKLHWLGKGWGRGLYRIQTNYGRPSKATVVREEEAVVHGLQGDIHGPTDGCMDDRSVARGTKWSSTFDRGYIWSIMDRQKNKILKKFENSYSSKNNPHINIKRQF